MSRTLITRKGRTIGYETLDATGRRFHLGQPPRTHQAPPQARCPECQRYRGPGTEACTNCGAIPAPMPAAPVTPAPLPMPVAAPWWEPAVHPAPTRDLPGQPVQWTPKTGPETMGQRLDRAIAERAGGVRVGNFGTPPAPAPVAPVVHVRRLLNFGPSRSILDRVVERQQALGRQPASATQPPRTMTEKVCDRCGKPSCNHPPAPPKTLDLVQARQAARLPQMEAAAVDAGLPAIEKRVGMNA